MYKKLTCAFCLVISSLIIAVVVYLLWTRTNLFSEKALEINVPKISIYLVNATSRRDQLLYRKSSSGDFILDYGKLALSNEEGEEGANHYKPLRRNILRIQCHSNYPVQLKYIGYGNVTNARNHNRRQIEDFEDRSTYTYLTELDFVTVDEAITGRYDCQVRDDGVLHASTYVYIYAAGEKTFVSHSPREMVVDSGSFIGIPCSVSHPNKTVQLFSSLQPIQTLLEKEVDPEHVHRFDPKQGFVLYPNKWGSYICKDEKSSEFSGRITVFMPLGSVVKGRTLRISSQNVETTDRSLRLECRAKEPIDLRFINFMKFSKPTRESKNDSEEFPYAVRIKLNTEWFRGNTSMVDCITKMDNRVIKTWKFLKNQGKLSTTAWNCHPPLNFVDCVVNRKFVEIAGNNGEDQPNPQIYLKTTKERPYQYQCCSDRGDIRPVLVTYPCHTPTECELRSPCLSFRVPRNRTTFNCPLFDFANEAIYEGDKECTLLKVEKDSSGVIRCSLDNVMRDSAFFQGIDMNGIYSSTSMMASSRKKLESRQILHVVQKGFRSPAQQKGSPIRFECIGSKLHLASGFQFGVEKANEPIRYFVNKGARTDTGTASHHEWVDIPFTDHNFKRFYCFAPLINPPLHGSQWINISIPFRYDLHW